MYVYMCESVRINNIPYMCMLMPVYRCVPLQGSGVERREGTHIRACHVIRQGETGNNRVPGKSDSVQNRRSCLLPKHRHGGGSWSDPNPRVCHFSMSLVSLSDLSRNCQHSRVVRSPMFIARDTRKRGVWPTPIPHPDLCSKTVSTPQSYQVT